MGWDMIGALGGAIAYGPIGAVAGYVGGTVVDMATADGGGNKKPAPDYPSQPDYSALMVYMSDNNKQTALAQIEAQKFQMQQASLDRGLQMAANLELSMEKFDTKLQMAKLDYFQQMTQEENRHTEKLTQIGLSSNNSYEVADLPPPPEV